MAPVQPAAQAEWKQAVAWSRPGGLRPMASGMIRGCVTTVTADTAEQAERFLAKMTAHA